MLPPLATLGGAPLRLAVFYGPMCAAKTAALLALAAALPASLPRVVLASAVDTRGDARFLASRDGARLAVTARLADLRGVAPRAHTLYVLDEAQFFPRGDVLRLARDVAAAPGAALLAAGLDRDFTGAPWGDALALARAAAALGAARGGLAVPLAARCCHRAAPAGAPCGAPARLTQRLAAGGAARVAPGGADAYRPACDAHHVPAPIDGAAWADVA
jgi:thymidine kinase